MAKKNKTKKKETVILINADSYGTRVAVLENKNLVGLHFGKKNVVNLVGNIYYGRITNMMTGINSFFAEVEKDKSFFVPYEEEAVLDHDLGKEKIEPKKFENLKKGQKILLQVSKNSIGAKCPRATTRIAIPGRYIVLIPFAKHIGISRKIEDEKERERLKELGEAIKPDNCGLIIRTNAALKSKDVLKMDCYFLHKVWDEIKQKIKSIKFGLVYKDLDLSFKIIRDIFTKDVTKVVVDNKKLYEDLLRFFDFLPRNMLSKIKKYRGKQPIFEYHKVEKEIDHLRSNRIELASGGWLTIEETEALTSIDINSGKFTSSKNLEETAFRINLEAAVIATRQIKLRDIGGIIIIDFIDMQDKKHQRCLHNKLEESFADDKARTNVYPLTELGLMQITRKRESSSLVKYLLDECPFCKGRGKIISSSIIIEKILRDLSCKLNECANKIFYLTVSRYVASKLMKQDEILFDLEKKFHKKIYIRALEDVALDYYKIEV